MNQIQFANAYRDGFRRTIRFILSKGFSPPEAEEIAQTAWTRGWEHRAELHNANSVNSWINTIALNVLRNVSRRRKREVPLDGKEILARHATRSTDRLDLQRMLSSCNAVDQTLFRLRHIEGFSTPEAARRCGVSAVTARVRMMRARRRMLETYGMLPRASGRCGASGAKSRGGNQEAPKANDDCA